MVRNIEYLNKTFTDYRSQLINYTKSYFPNTYTDFSPTSPGMMFMEQSAYVGDVLSFYLDNQIQETFLQHARQEVNLYKMAYMFGYKPKTTGLASVMVDIYQQVPSKLENGEYIPDLDYCLNIGENAILNSTNGVNFILEDSIDFSISNSQDPTEITIAQFSGNNPSYFLLKKTKKAISSTIKSVNISFGSPEEYPTRTISDSSVAGIIDVIDSNGNYYDEVDYLGQELIFEGYKNNPLNGPQTYGDTDTPYILQTRKTQRRFTSRFKDSKTLQLQFGSGNPDIIDEEIIPNPNNVGLGLPYGQSKMTTALDPKNFLKTNTYGVAPSNIILTVRYISGGGVTSNVAAGSISSIDKSNVKFQKYLPPSTLTDGILDSLVVSNPEAASGGQDGDTVEEIRYNTMANFNSQMRNVTQEDYLVRTLSMPPKYGVISKAFTQKSPVNESNSTLDIFTLTYDSNYNLKSPSNSLKQNLKTYLNEYKIIGDVINIKNAFVVNIACDFEIITKPGFNNNEVLLKCINFLKDYFNIEKWKINQPIILSDIYSLLDNIKGVQTVKNVFITNKTDNGSQYSPYAYDMSSATQNKVIYPSLDPCIFELKYPNEDIKGKVVTL